MATPDMAAKTHTALIQLDIAELACRLGEAFIGLPRPAELSPREALAMLPDDSRDGLCRAARIAIEYVVQTVQAGMAGHVTIVSDDGQDGRPN